MPFIRRNLAGGENRALARPVVDHLQKVVLSLALERSESPIVEDEQVDPLELGQKPKVQSRSLNFSQPQA